MRELLLGGIVVGLIAGIVVGRTSERARRNYKDFTVAKAAVPKGRTVAYGDVRRAALAILVAGGLMVAIFLGVMNLS